MGEIITEPTQSDLVLLDNFGLFSKFQRTWAFQQFVNLPHSLITLMTGNQSMKTSGCAFQYVLRIMSWHPIPEKNLLYFECPSCDQKFNVLQLPKDWLCPVCKSELKEHERGCRIFRFASEVLPGETSDAKGEQSTEVKNSVYPEFKKWLPPCYIKKDIKHRNMAMTLYDPQAGNVFCGKEYKGHEIIVELVAYSQTVQSTAGKQRASIWEDEEPPYDFHEEQLPRLMAEHGDLLLSLTPANRLSWTYDEIFEHAQLYIRTPAICDFLRTPDYDPPQIEYTESPKSIAVIQAATDDNPTLSLDAIEDLMSQYDDPDIIATRRYGIHKQVKGRIFKGFDYKVHFIDAEQYFPYGVPHDWNHARGIDYHPQTPWACGCISLSPENEAFIWLDYNPSPEKYTTKEICLDFSTQSKDYKFILNLIDPLSEGIKKDKITVLDDINEEFYQLKREGIGTGGYFVTWDTKGEKGRDAIRERLKNSIRCERPYNNKAASSDKFADKRGYLPTLWILNNCKTAAKMMKMWRWDEYTETRFRMLKEEKNKPQEKWSHFPMVFEAIFKHPAFRPPRKVKPIYRSPKRYFQGRG